MQAAAKSAVSAKKVSAKASSVAKKPKSAALAVGKTTVMIPLNKLVRWAHNPRKVKSPQTVENIAASIVTNGLEYPLKAIVLNRAVDAYTVYMGSTRHDAYDLLHAQKHIPADHPIECVVDDIDEEEAFARAVKENVARETFHEVDRADAVAKMAGERMSAGEIARTIGMDKKEVHKALDVARLDDRSKDLIRSNKRPYLWGYALSKAPAPLRNRILEEINDQPTAWSDASQIRAAINKQRIPATHALFDYQAEGLQTSGDFFEVADSDNKGWISDTEAFWTAQNRAIEQLRETLEREGHSTVDIMRGRPFTNEKGYQIDHDAIVRHAVIAVAIDGKVDVHRDLFDPSSEAGIFDVHEDADEDTFGDSGRAAAKSPTHVVPNAKAGGLLTQVMTAHALDAIQSDDDALRVLLAALIEDDEIRAAGPQNRTAAQAAMRIDLVIDAKGLDPATAKSDEVHGQVDIATLPRDRDTLVALLARYTRSSLSVTRNAKSPFGKGEGSLLLRRVASASSVDLRTGWTPDARLFETFDLEGLRALAHELLANETYAPDGMSRKQLVNLLDESFRSAKDGTSMQDATTQALLNAWVPRYMD